MSFFSNLFKKKEIPDEKFSVEEYEKYDNAKQLAIEGLLGKMYNMVGHAIIPFQIGGAVDMYYFPNHIEGTGFATMELIEPDGTGPKPNDFGTYELLAFTRKEINKDSDNTNEFDSIERRFCGIFTTIGKFSNQAVLKPGDTCEVPRDDGENICLLFDQYPNNKALIINNMEHHLLLCIEVYRCEMEYSRENGSDSIFEKLKAANYYPYSDMNRNPVV